MYYTTKQRVLAAVIMAVVGVVGFGTYTYASQYQRGNNGGNTGGTSSRMVCTILSSDMYYGWTGNTANDLHSLQAFFIADGYTNVSSSGTFDQATLTALQTFQADQGLPLTSYVDPATRARIQQVSCSGVGNGGSQNTSGQVSVTGVDGPAQINVGQSGTWTVHVSIRNGAQGGQMHYSVVWGDEVQYASTYGNNQYPAQTVQGTGTFTHVYTRTGTFTPTFTVTDDYGHSAQGSVSTIVGNSNNGYCPQGQVYQNGYCVTQGNNGDGNSGYCQTQAGYYDRHCVNNPNYNPGNTGNNTYCPQGQVYQNGYCVTQNNNGGNSNYCSTYAGSYDRNCYNNSNYNPNSTGNNGNTGTGTDYCSTAAAFYDLGCAVGAYGNTPVGGTSRTAVGGSSRTGNTNSNYNPNNYNYNSNYNTNYGNSYTRSGNVGGSRRSY